MRKKFTRFYEILAHTWYGRRIISFAKFIVSRDPLQKKLKVDNKGSLRITKSIYGKKNSLLVGKNACLDGVTIKILGSRNIIIIGENTVIGKDCKIYLFGRGGHSG